MVMMPRAMMVMVQAPVMVVHPRATVTVVLHRIGSLRATRPRELRVAEQGIGR
jgi:hypothetical protein